MPLIVIDPLPGQEEENADYIEKCGVGIWIKDKTSIKDVLLNIFTNPYLLQNMKVKARLIAKKNSTRDICEILLKNDSKKLY